MIHTIYRQIAMPGSSWGTRLEDGGNRAAIQMAEAVAGGSVVSNSSSTEQ
jgi:hypothetical protein